jgi:hypothetical protein
LDLAVPSRTSGPPSFFFQRLYEYSACPLSENSSLAQVRRKESDLAKILRFKNDNRQVTFNFTSGAAASGATIVLTTLLW